MGVLRSAPDETIRFLRELIRAFFADYLRLVERDAAALLDLERVAFLRLPRAEAGLAARIPVRKGGASVTVLAHLEPDLPTPAAAAESMVRMLRALRISYGEPVLATLLALRGGRPGVSLETAPLAKLSAIELSRIFFTTFCLSDTKAEIYLQRPEPLAWVLSILMRPARRTVEEHVTICREKIGTAPAAPRQRALLHRGIAMFLAHPASRR